ncbi:MAG: cation transporter, partial [Oscillospiraceae bacterium]
MTSQMYFLIEGMVNSDCAYAIKQSIEKIKGVKTARINLKKHTMSITTHCYISPLCIEASILELGYYPFYQVNSQNQSMVRTLCKKNLILVLIFAFLELYIATAATFSLPLPHIINPLSNTPNFIIVQIFLTTIVLIAGIDIILNGVKQLVLCKPNINSLIAISILCAYSYSLSQTLSNPFANVNFYYESTTIIMLFIIVANYLESQSKFTAQKNIIALLRFIPTQATLVSNHQQKTIKAALVKEGNIVVVEQGQQIPVDGIICH